jgi:membrane-bound metal-dependent hydrolase YbcI (DUF457 family)
MLGHSHALSGGLTGTAAGSLLGMPVPHTLALGGFTAGMALLPDLDSCGSSPARCLGLLSEAVSVLVRFVSGGHRHATHSFLGIGVFTGLAALACAFRHDYAGMAGLALLIALTVSAGAEATRATNGHIADVVGVVVAAGVVFAGYGLTLIPVAVAIGCATHIAGDLLTDSGCMLWFPLSKRRFHLLPEPLAFTTGTRPELLIVDPALVIALSVVAAWVADPVIVQAGLRASAHVF